ncbi:MAG: hypothetical protein HN597_03670 [Desulfobacula sp.]|nr:hypothetical protein [Desulfobacula sp.]
MPNETKPWQPHPGPQTEFCQRGEFEVFFGGAKGPGKTDCLIAEAARYVWHPKYHGLLLRRTFPRLQEIIDRCWLLYPTIGGEYRSGEHRWYFPGGGKVTLGHVQHEQDKYNYHGKEFHFLGFDELTEFLESIYLFIIANVRRSVSDLKLRVRSTSNPGGKGHAWVKDRFVDTCIPIQKQKYIGGDAAEHEMFIPEIYIDPDAGTSRCFVPATVYDNPSIIVNDPGYVRRLELLPELEKKRFLYGVWDIFEGQVFTELTQHTHGCEDFPIPHEWERVMVFDWGYARPWCALWFAIDYDGVIYLYREKMGWVDEDPNKGARQTNTEICREIQKLETEKISFRVSDPACWGPTKIKGSNMVLGPSFVEDASREGLFFLKADNDRLRGKQQVHQRFKMDVTLNEETGVVLEETPQFVAFNSCKRWWEEMQSLYEDPKNPEDVDSDQPDENYDCLHGDTEVETDKGVFKIKDLVGRKGKVKTVFGLWTDFDNCKLYRKNSEIVRVIFDDGKSVVCTPDHNFLTGDFRWVKAKYLLDCDRYVNISDTINKRSMPWTPKLSVKRFRNLMETVIIYVENTFKEEGYSFTERFGSGIMAKFRKGMLSIIKTTTAAIIILKILGYYAVESITPIMQKTQTMQIGLRRCTKGRKNGMGVKMGKIGTSSITKETVRKKCTKNLKKFVNFVERSLKEIFVQSFAPIIVNQQIAGAKGLTISQRFALSVGKNSRQTNTNRQKPVVKNAVGKCVKIEPAGKTDTYCLTAKLTHSFQINKGVIVSNCTRYMFMSRPIIPKRTDPIPQGTFQSERRRLIRAKNYAKRHGVSLAAAYGAVR